MDHFFVLGAAGEQPLLAVLTDRALLLLRQRAAPHSTRRAEGAAAELVWAVGWRAMATELADARVMVHTADAARALVLPSARAARRLWQALERARATFAALDTSSAE